jgi:hypothetical protein
MYSHNQQQYYSRQNEPNYAKDLGGPLMLPVNGFYAILVPSKQSPDHPPVNELTTPTSEVHKPKRHQISLACERCRRMKLSCTEKRPCDRCVRKNYPCKDAPPKRNRKAVNKERSDSAENKAACTATVLSSCFRHFRRIDMTLFLVFYLDEFNIEPLARIISILCSYIA